MDFDLSDIFGGPLGLNLLGGGGQMFSKLPELPVGGTPPAPSLLKAGDNDMRPQGLLAPGAGLFKAGLETGPSQAGGVPRGGLLDGPPPAMAGSFSGSGGADTLQGGTVGAATPPTTTAALATPPMPKPTTVQRDPDAGRVFPSVTTPTIPNSRGGPDERGPGEPRPIVPPKIDVAKPTSSGAPAVGPTTQAPPPAAAPAATPAKPGEEPNRTTLQKFLSEMGNAKVGAGQGNQPRPASMSYGQPHIPQGAAELYAKILASHADMIKKVGVPQMPRMQRY